MTSSHNLSSSSSAHVSANSPAFGSVWTDKVHVIIVDENDEVMSISKISSENGNKIKTVCKLLDDAVLEAKIIKVQIYGSNIPDAAAAIVPAAAIATASVTAAAAFGVAAATANPVAFVAPTLTVAQAIRSAAHKTNLFHAASSSVFHHDTVLFTCLFPNDDEFFVTLEKLTHGIVLQLARKKESVREHLIGPDWKNMTQRENLFQEPLETGDCKPETR